ncbi:MAG: hypothetical protein GQ574_04230 [Crocinitomix sp.]|nr:hypothetical protein [Crocinitomix sp.]
MKKIDARRVSIKKSKLVSSLAKSTGVDTRSVEAVLKKLGLDTALANRIYAQEHADQLGVEVKGLNQVKWSDMRIAVTDASM